MSALKSPTRRQLLAGAAAALAAPAVLSGGRARAAGDVIRIGFVTPRSGSLAFFGEPDDFILASFAEIFAEGAGGRPIEVIVKDSQSSASRASDVAADLILADEVSLILSAGGPDTVNPVADQAEVNGIPSLSTACPWQPFVMGRGSTPDKGFDYSFLFGVGLEDVIAAYLKLWEGVDTNKKVGVLFGNDADGNAWADPQFGFPPALAKAGFEVVDPGRFQPLSDDFSSFLSAFKSAGVEIVTGTMIPPDFLTFWSQAAQQGLAPHVATIGKALLLPAVLEASGSTGNGLSTEVAWHPAYPFVSATTGETGTKIAEDWTAATGRPWVQTIGLKHALFDLAVDVLRRSSDPTDADSVVDAIRATQTMTTAGPADFAGSPIASVTKSVIVGGQWAQEGDGYRLEIAANPTDHEIPITRPLQAL